MHDQSTPWAGMEFVGYLQVPHARATSHKAVIGKVSQRFCVTRTGCGNFTSVSINAASTPTIAAFIHCDEPMIRSVGTIKFQVAGKPRNQLSSVIMSVRANHIADMNTTAPAMGRLKLSGSRSNWWRNTAGTTTHVT